MRETRTRTKSYDWATFCCDCCRDIEFALHTRKCIIHLCWLWCEWQMHASLRRRRREHIMHTKPQYCGCHRQEKKNNRRQARALNEVKLVTLYFCNKFPTKIVLRILRIISDQNTKWRTRKRRANDIVSDAHISQTHCKRFVLCFSFVFSCDQYCHENGSHLVEIGEQSFSRKSEKLKTTQTTTKSSSSSQKQ